MEVSSASNKSLTKASSLVKLGIGEGGSPNNGIDRGSYKGSGLPGINCPGSLVDSPRPTIKLATANYQVNHGQLSKPLSSFGVSLEEVELVVGGGLSYSLDTCDQVHKTRLKPCKIRAEKSWDREKYRLGYKQALVEALSASGREGDALMVKACGEDFRVGKCLDCGAAPAFPVTCDHRLCPGCAARRGAILTSEHEDILKQIRYPKMLTLTFRSVDRLDKVYIKWARNCFTKLRRRKVMASCWGGIYSFEATYNVRGWHYDVRREEWWWCKKDGWHLHVHALIGSGYIDQGKLSREWKKVSGARIVDIRAVQGKDKWDGVREVIKYPAKAASFLNEPRLVNEFLDATEGVNLAYGFGAMYRVKTRRHASAKMRCPICGGSDISFDDGFGFCVPRMAVKKMKGGYIWRSPPGEYSLRNIGAALATPT